MNDLLAYTSGVLNPVALVLGVALTVQVWRLKNPVFVVIALLLACYQVRNVITALSVVAYSAELVRPTGLLAWSISGRGFEIVGTALAMLYLGGKIEMTWMMRRVLTPDEMEMPASAPVAGEMPLSFWQQSHYESAARAIRENIKPEYLRDR